MKKKSLLQKMVSSKNVTLSDWLALKPYGQAVPNYDTFYVQRCQEVLTHLSVYDKWFQWNGVTQGQLKELSCQLVSYFEDYINDIGIWRAYIETNEALYGYALPFYDLSEYDKDYINFEDIAFLIWHYVTKYSENEYITDPEHDNILDMAEEICAHLETVIDNSPAIDVYDKFFTIKDNEDYFVFKTKMNWFSTESYLLGIDFKGQIQDLKAQAIQEAKASKMPATDLSAILYSYLEKYLYQKRSSYSALNGPEWFAKIAKCSEQRKQEILDLTYWIDGKFYMKEKQKDYFIFEHLITNVQYKARADSFQNNQNMKPSDTTAFNMHLMRWNGIYWLSGMMFSTEMTPLSIKQYKTKRFDTPWMLPDTILQNMTETTQLMYDAFIAFFGSPMAIFDNNKQLEKANMEYMDYYSTTLKAVITDTFEERSKKFREAVGETNWKPMSDFHTNTKESIGLFFIKDIGMQTCGGVKEVIKLLKAPTLTKDQEASLFIDFANGYVPPVCAYFLSQYDGKNIKMPTNESVDSVKHLPFFYRMNSPEEFDRPYPLITMIHQEDVDA
jgi:hypothetical protein